MAAKAFLIRINFFAPIIPTLLGCLIKGTSTPVEHALD